MHKGFFPYTKLLCASTLFSEQCAIFQKQNNSNREQNMDWLIIGYITFSIFIVGLTALYINKPHLFQVTYVQWPWLHKLAFAFACGFLPFALFANWYWFILGITLTLFIYVILHRQKYLAFIKLRT